MIDNIAFNFRRLCTDQYDIDHVFQKDAYSWPGDWEGRALLAFCCHYEMHKTAVPCMHPLVAELKAHTNNGLYFGSPFDGQTVNEQQLSGHSWYLRGLLKYYRLFRDPVALEAAKSTVEQLYLPALPFYDHYPLKRPETDGGVSGHTDLTLNGWILSSDVGCAFMCVDGLADYYSETRDPRVKHDLDTVITLFSGIDLLTYRFQTHTTLTCLRGILTLYECTGDDAYLRIAEEKFDYYQQHGMTLTYENFNWFGRPDTWTEPCAVVDSLILAVKLYRITGQPRYRTLARRIWFNGLQFCQRQNGGVGPNTCVTPENPVLSVSMYEAPFCCTMRYADGLLCYTQNEALFTVTENDPESTDELGRHFLGDRLLVKTGSEIQPIFSCRDFDEAQARAFKLEVIY